MSKRNRTPDISPPERTDLLTLSQEQAGRVGEAVERIEEASLALEDSRAVLNGLLGMVKPEGTTGFDVSTMTFYSEPSSEPKE